MLAFLAAFVVSTENQTSCPLPNTQWDTGSGKCVCHPGYFTDPAQFPEFGCWKCDTSCHPLARCVHPGHCQCQAQFVGDGIANCDNPVPALLGLSNRVVTATGASLLTFAFRKDPTFEPRKMFCQLGAAIIPATEIKQIDSQRGEVTCLVPRTTSGKFAVSVSFDSFHWSPNTVRVALEMMDNVEEIEKAKPFLITLTVFIFIGICVNYGKSLFFTVEVPEDEEACLERRL